MKNKKHVTGIVCEYNPFHYGHKLHIDKTKEKTNPDVLICVMSGNFVQRGEPAIINKWDRAKTAVEHGVDLVVELPFIYATQSANMFAKGAIDVLKQCQIDSLVFGSESNNLDILEKLAKLDDDITSFQHTGLSSAKAYEQIYGPLNPNDILGLNYIKQLRDSNITPYTIQRTTNYHDSELSENISSATAIRESIYLKKEVQNTTPMKQLDDHFQMKKYFPYLKTLLSVSDPNDLKQLFLMDEGIEHNLIKNAKNATTYEKFLDLCISKRYTKSKIQRTLTHLLHQTKKETANHLEPIQHIRILAFNERGRTYLHDLDKKTILASKFMQIPKVYREMEFKSASVYASILPLTQQQQMIQSEFQPPIFIRKKHTD